MNRRLKALEKEGKADGLEEGNSLKGELLFAYASRIESMLSETFNIPAFMSGRNAENLMVTLKIRIDATGKPFQVSITRPSISNAYDNAVLNNAKNIKTFGPPPITLRSQLRGEGVEVDLCPVACKEKG